MTPPLESPRGNLESAVERFGDVQHAASGLETSCASTDRFCMPEGSGKNRGKGMTPSPCQLELGAAANRRGAFHHCTVCKRLRRCLECEGRFESDSWLRDAPLRLG